MNKLLFVFHKHNQVRYLSHLDLMRVFERAIRRAGLPVAFSEGFNPRPKLVFASALALGATSDAEQGTVELTEPLDPREFRERLNKQLPEGLEILDARDIPTQGKSPLMALQIAEYRLQCANDASGISMEDLRTAVRDFLAQEHCCMVRKSPKGDRRIDIRSKVLGVEPESTGDEIVLRLRVAIGGEGSVKPSEVVTVLAERLPGLRLVHVHRTDLMPAQVSAGKEIDTIDKRHEYRERSLPGTGTTYPGRRT